MLRMYYACVSCKDRLTTLTDAQRHADASGHVVTIRGDVLPSDNVADLKKLDASDQARRKAHDAAVLRAARDRGLA